MQQPRARRLNRRARTSIAAAVVGAITVAGLVVVAVPGNPAFAACTGATPDSVPGCGGATPTPSVPFTASPDPTPSPLGVTVGSDGWITYTNTRAAALALTSPKTTTVNGAFDADGNCVISDSGTIASGASAAYTEETGYNPTTCQERIVTGGVSAATVDGLADPQTADTVGGNDAGVSNVDAVAASTSYSSAFEKTAWIDPLNITITSLTTNLRWPLYGAGGTLTGRNNPYEFRYDGWSNSGTPPVRFTTLSGNTGWKVNAAESFTNTDFASFVYVVFGVAGWLACGAPLTATAHFHHNVTVLGYRSGSRGWAWSD